MPSDADAALTASDLSVGDDEVADRDSLASLLERLAPDTAVIAVAARLDGLAGVSHADGAVAELSQQVMQRVRDRLGDHAVVPVGLDQVLVVAIGSESESAAELVIELVTEAVRQPLATDFGFFELSVSSGWTSTEVSAPTTLLVDAAVALDEALRRRTAQSIRYDDRLRRRTQRRTRLLHDLPLALARDQLFLDFQPIHDLHELTPVGAEALLRWQHPDHGLLKAADFISLAEQSGVIADLSWWVADQAVRALVALREAFPSTDDFSMAINVSGRQLNDDRLVRDLDRVFELHGVTPDRITVELTETALLAGDGGVDTLLRLSDLGCRLAIDDFGAGFASLDHLSRLPVSTVKLHPSFVHRIEEPRVVTLVDAVLSMCRQLDVQLTAEGIESSAQLRRIRDVGVALGQGYVLGRPAALDSLIGEQAAAGVLRPRHGPSVLVP